MSLLIYPPPTIESREDLDWAAQPIEGIDGSIVSARGIRSSPLHKISLDWRGLSPQEALDLDAQLRALKGMQTPCHVYSPLYQGHADIPVGTGDGSTTWWRVPLTDVDLSVTPTLKVGGTAQSSSEWGIGWENLLPSSENLGDATTWMALYGATVTRTGGQTAPDGSSTAWRIQTTGGTDIGKLDNIGNGGTYLPANWRVYMSVWVRNLSATTYVTVEFRGFTILARIAPSTPWTFYSGVVLQSVSFPPGIRFRADNATDSLDFLVWRPMIIAFTPDGSMVPSKEWGNKMGYVPTPTGQYIAGDLTLRRWTVGLRTAPANGQAVTLSAWGRRLLWGRVTSYGMRAMYAGSTVSATAEIVASEATGSET